MSTLGDIWDRLSVGGESSPGYVRLRIKTVDSCAAYAALSMSDGLEALVVEIDTEELPGRFEKLASRGVALWADPLIPGRRGRTRLVLSLEDRQYRGVFKALAEDVVARLVSATSQAEAAAGLVNRLAHWQRFLREFGSSGLTREQRHGLFGELTFFSDHVLNRFSARSAVDTWTGCTGANHDFQFAAGAVEVKTSAANTLHSFAVSNVAQLTNPENGALLVHLVHIAEHESATHSLTSLVDSVRRRLDESAHTAFEECLSSAGFLDSQRELYERPRYSVLSQRFFLVGEGFPRLLADQLQPGVENVRYDVAVAVCSPFEVSESELWTHLSKSSTGGRQGV